MKTNKKHILYLIPLLILALTGCVRDKGNYKYSEIDEVKEIEGIDKNYELSYGETLHILPQVSFTLDKNKESFSYEWAYLEQANPTSGITNVVSVGEDKELNLLVSRDIFKTSGQKKMVLKVKNTETDMVYQKRFTINILVPMALGYVAICEKPKGFDLDIIADFRGELSLHTNILEVMDSSLPRENRVPRQVITGRDICSPTFPNTTNYIYALYVTSDKGNDRLLPSDYSYEPNYNISNVSILSEGYFPDGDIVFDKLHMPSTGEVTYGFHDNNWFYQRSHLQIHLFKDPINRIKDTDVYFRVAPYIACHVGSAVVYDIDKNIFLYHRIPSGDDAYYPSRINCCINFDDNEGDPFEWNDSNQELIYMTEFAESNTTSSFDVQMAFAIVKNKKTEQINYLQFYLYFSTAEKELKTTLPNADIEHADFICRYPDGNYLYYVVNNQIKCVHLSTMSMIDMPNNLIPANESISAFKFTIYKSRPLLTIGSYDPSGEVGTNGSLHFFEIDGFTGMPKLATHPAKPTATGKVQEMSWKGLGKVTDIAVKTQ